MTKILEGKVALVTGASRGIGRAIADALKAQGAEVIGTATTEEGARAIGGKVLNVSDSQSIEKLFSEIKAPDILVNNAAITRDNLLLRMKEEEWEAVIDANLNGVFRLCKIAVKHMLKARWGRIINLSSVVGLSGNPGQCNYSAAKAGLLGFTRSLAQEIASRNITVNAVAPGFVDTDMTKALPEAQRQLLLDKIPCQRLGAPEDIAAVVAFLASPQAGYITGETINVNGGMYMQ